MRIFYRSVFLLRPNQIQKLLSTLEISAARSRKSAASDDCYYDDSPQRWIRKIYIRLCEAPSVDVNDITLPLMRNLLSRCHSVESIAEVLPIKSKRREVDDIITIPFVHFLDDTAALAPAFSAFGRLRSLTMWLGKDEFPEEGTSLPALQSLSIIVRPHGLSSLDDLGENWHIPSLEGLSIKLHGVAVKNAVGNTGDPYAGLSNTLHNLFRKCGENVKTFTLDGARECVAINLGVMFRDNVLPKLEHLSYPYAHAQRLAPAKLQVDRLVLQFLRRITLLPSTALESYVGHLSHLIGDFQDLRDSRTFPALKVVELRNPDPVNLPFITQHSERWALGASLGKKTHDARLFQMRLAQRQAVVRGIGRAINDLLGDSKEVIIDSTPIHYIADTTIFNPLRLWARKKADQAHSTCQDSFYSEDEGESHMVVDSLPIGEDNQGIDMEVEEEVARLEEEFIIYD